VDAHIVIKREKDTTADSITGDVSSLGKKGVDAHMEMEIKREKDTADNGSGDVSSLGRKGVDAHIVIKREKDMADNGSLGVSPLGGRQGVDAHMGIKREKDTAGDSSGDVSPLGRQGVDAHVVIKREKDTEDEVDKSRVDGNSGHLSDERDGLIDMSEIPQTGPSELSHTASSLTSMTEDGTPQEDVLSSSLGRKSPSEESEGVRVVIRRKRIIADLEEEEEEDDDDTADNISAGNDEAYPVERAEAKLEQHAKVTPRRSLRNRRVLHGAAAISPQPRPPPIPRVLEDPLDAGEDSMPDLGPVLTSCLARAKSLLSDPRNIFASEEQMLAWIQQLSEIEKRAQPKISLIAVVGISGAGKSTLLNALMGEGSVLPTSGLQACTAAVIKMEYKSQDHYDVVIEFIPIDDWFQDVKDLLEELIDENGQINPLKTGMGFAAMKKRVTGVYGSTIFESLTQMTGIDQMMDFLKQQTDLTRMLGTKITVTASDSKDLKAQIEPYVNISRKGQLDGQFWPIVKEVHMRGRFRGCPRHSMLVDLPGVEDQNAARVKVTTDFMRHCHTTLIVSAMHRAHDEKTAWKVLGSTFRRQVVMDGVVDQIGFVCTKADEAKRSELINELDLSSNATLKDCCLARNMWCKASIRQRFQASMDEMLGDGDDNVHDVSRVHRTHDFSLPVFTVSSHEFLQLTGKAEEDGPPKVFATLKDTEIPSLRDFLRDRENRGRIASLNKSASELDALVQTMDQFVRNPISCIPGDTASMKRRFATIQEEISTRLKKAVKHAVGKIGRAIQDDLIAKALQSAQVARAASVETVTHWSRFSGTRWNTYRKTMRLHGIWRENVNQIMCDPLYDGILSSWNFVFDQDMPNEINRFGEKLQEEMAAFRVEVGKMFSSYNVKVDEALIQDQKQVDNLAANRELDVLKEKVASMQQDANRKIVESIKNGMEPAYSEAAAHNGKGMFIRMRNTVEKHVTESDEEIFALATETLVNDLKAIISEVEKEIEATSTKVVTSSTLLYSQYWGPQTFDPSVVQQVILPGISSLKSEVKGILSKASDFLAKINSSAPDALSPTSAHNTA